MRLLARIVGWLFAWIGGLLIFGFLYFELHGGSARRPFWADALIILVFGVLPLCSGIQLLRRRYTGLKVAMKWICMGGIATFALGSILHLVFPEFASRELGVIAVAGLFASVISGVVWFVALSRWRSKHQKHRHERRPEIAAANARSAP